MDGHIYANEPGQSGHDQSTEATYSHASPNAVPSVAVIPPSAARNKSTPPDGAIATKTNLLTALVGLSLLIALVSIILAAVALQQSYSSVPDNVSRLAQISQENRSAVMTSCLAILNQGQRETGIYKLTLNPDVPEITAYCDMTTDGGGWTLVASIHENNIDGKCTVGDKWSSEQGTSVASTPGRGSWADLTVFGDIRSVTSGDYKNAAYFDLEASDLMIWHVPNDVKIEDIGEETFLKYYTTSKFLSKYGSTLQRFYQDYAPMTHNRVDVFVQNLATEITSRQDDLSNLILDFYRYAYDGPEGTISTNILDGGNDMYDRGNIVSFKVDDEDYVEMQYGSLYSGSGYQAVSAAIHPFITLAWIGAGSKNSTNISSFSIKVVSGTGADHQGNFTTYESTVSIRTYSIGYRAFHVFDTIDPSICEVYFYIDNDQKWDSITPNVDFPSWSQATDDLENEIRFTGGLNVLVGYMLLSKFSGQPIFQHEIELVLEELVQIVDNVPLVFEKMMDVDFSFPVTFAQGTSRSVLLRVPDSEIDVITPGFVQLGAHDTMGFPYALCPGLRVKKGGRPELHCVGGINSLLPSFDRNTCGDFTGWKGDVTPLPLIPSDHGRSLDDINSSILIFTRNSD